MNTKSTVDEIRERFDKDVERFSVLQTGQSATMDAPLALELICTAAAGATPGAKRLLDVGCGAGNFSLKMLEKVPNLDVMLVDLSAPMLERAKQRVSAATKGKVVTVQSDIRELELGAGSFDVLVAGAVLHHLRGDEDWRNVVTKLHRSLTPRGSFWIWDMVEHDTQAIHAMMMQRFGDHLTNLKDAAYRDEVFAYIQKEDTPRSLLYQVDLMRQAGFRTVEILHKNAVFAAFGAVK
jgi:tRNA (cmo5U34)-methyltransferase